MHRPSGLLLATAALLLSGCSLFSPTSSPTIVDYEPARSSATPASGLSLPPVSLPAGGGSTAVPSPTAGPTTAPTTAAGDVRTATDAAAFATPSGRIVCMITPDSTRCDFVGTDKAWQAPRPANCELDWGSSLYVTTTAGSTCAGDTVVDTASVDSDYVSWRKASDPTVTVYDLKLAALPYGSSLVVGTYRCDSASTGVTCKNTTTGHGFTMAREAYAIF